MTPEEFAERLWDFAVEIAILVERLPDTRVGRHVAGQLIRCGTSSAPNYEEACVAESRKDFVHKIGVARKEMREVRGWLRFVVKMKLQIEPSVNLPSLLNECEQLLRMLGKSAHTARQPFRREEAAPPRIMIND